MKYKSSICDHLSTITKIFNGFCSWVWQFIISIVFKFTLIIKWLQTNVTGLSKYQIYYLLSMKYIIFKIYHFQVPLLCSNNVKNSTIILFREGMLFGRNIYTCTKIHEHVAVFLVLLICQIRKRSCLEEVILPSEKNNDPEIRKSGCHHYGIGRRSRQRIRYPAFTDRCQSRSFRCQLETGIGNVDRVGIGIRTGSGLFCCVWRHLSRWLEKVKNRFFSLHGNKIWKDSSHSWHKMLVTLAILTQNITT
jgi:hypothetical protein